MTRLWAEIQTGKVRGIHERTDGKVPVFSPDSEIDVVEVTGANPMPQSDWKYDQKTGKFSLPDPKPPPTDKEKIGTEMLGPESRTEAIIRLKAKGDLPEDYME